MINYRPFHDRLDQAIAKLRRDLVVEAVLDATGGDVAIDRNAVAAAFSGELTGDEPQRIDDIDRQQRDDHEADTDPETVNRDQWAPLLDKYNRAQADADQAMVKARTSNDKSDLEMAMRKTELADQTRAAYERTRYPDKDQGDV